MSDEGIPSQYTGLVASEAVFWAAADKLASKMAEEAWAAASPEFRLVILQRLLPKVEEKLLSMFVEEFRREVTETVRKQLAAASVKAAVTVTVRE